MRIIHDPLDTDLFKVVKPASFYITPLCDGLSIGFYVNSGPDHPETSPPKIMFQDDPLFRPDELNPNYVKFKEEVLSEGPKLLFVVSSKSKYNTNKSLYTNYVLIPETSEEIEGLLKFNTAAKHIRYRYEPSRDNKLFCVLQIDLFI